MSEGVTPNGSTVQAHSATTRIEAIIWPKGVVALP